MTTFGAGRVALITVLGLLAVGCSREQQDWRSAEAADTREAYGRFLEQHPDSELAAHARTRIAQIAEERDWVEAGTVASADAYRAFLAQHPNGKWSEEARIRIEAFSLGSAPRLAPSTLATAGGYASGALRRTRVAARDREGAARRARERRAGCTADPGRASSRGASARVSAARPAGNSYRVQLGAFGSEASAGREWRRLQGRFGAQLGGLSPRIIAAGNTSGPLYRLQAPAAGEAQARALCDSLRERSQPCVPVLPR